jgi:hypothetical protein
MSKYGTVIGMHRIFGRIFRPFFISDTVTGIRPVTGFELPDIRPDTGY